MEQSLPNKQERDVLQNTMYLKHKSRSGVIRPSISFLLILENLWSVLLTLKTVCSKDLEQHRKFKERVSILGYCSLYDAALAVN